MIELPKRPLVKICGMMSVEIAQATNDAGADLMGFVFAKSRRQVTPEQVREIVNGVSGPIVPVGLFLDNPVEEINEMARISGVQLLQLHWRANDEDLKRFDLPYYLVRRALPEETYDDIAPNLDRVMSAPNPPLWIMVDAYHPQHSGGTGLLSDWELSARMAADYPLMLAGGLNPENVGDAIEQVRPAHVDVSSGVEIDGQKSPERIRAFVKNARDAFERYSSSSSETTTQG